MTPAEEAPGTGHGVVVDAATRPGGAVGTVVLVNSLGTSLAMWDAMVPLLTGLFDVVRYDQLGHGPPPVRAATTEIDDLVDDLLGVLDHVGVEHAHVAGISIGGMIAIRTASRAPDRVASLTPMCCAAVLDPQNWIERAATVRRRGLEAIVPAVMDRWFAPGFRDRRPEVVGAYADMLRSTTPEGYAVGCDVLAEADVRADLARVAAPALVVGGSEDPATPPREQRALARAIRNARLEILPSVGHLAPVAEPVVVAQLVMANALSAATSGPGHDDRSGCGDAP